MALTSIPFAFVSVYKMTGLPSRAPKRFCWTSVFDEFCAASHPPVVRTRAIRTNHERLGIMAKSVLRQSRFVMEPGRAWTFERSIGFQRAPAGRAEHILAQIDPLHRMRRSHCAAIVLAMMQVQCVPKFMNGLFEQALPQQSIVSLKTIEFLTQPER